MARLFDDAQNEYLSIDSAAITDAPFSMSAWFHIDSDAIRCGLVSIGDKDGTEYQALVAWEGEVWAHTYDSGVSRSAVTSTSYGANAWHHAAGVWAATNSRAAYLDGGGKGTEATNLSPDGLNRTAIGRYDDSTPAYPMSGHIAGAAIWDAVLTDAEVAVLAAGYCPLFVRPGSLVGYWPLGGVYDASDGDNDVVGGRNMTAYSDAAGPTVADHPPGLIYPATPFIRGPYTAAPAGIARPRVSGSLAEFGLTSGGLVA